MSDKLTIEQEFAQLLDAAKGSEFDLTPADGPIAKLTLFVHEHGPAILAAFQPRAVPDERVVFESVNWVMPIEAVHQDGRVLPAKVHGTNNNDRSQLWCTWGEYPNVGANYADYATGLTDYGWRIRNRTSNPVDAKPVPLSRVAALLDDPATDASVTEEGTGRHA